MKSLEHYKNNLFDSINEINFYDLALDLYQFQIKKNDVLAQYLNYLGVNASKIDSPDKIIYFPISIFKHHKLNINQLYEHFFISSGTTKGNLSKHFVNDHSFYLKNALQIFEQTFGCIQDYAIFAVVPSYQENPYSSLICMLDFFIKSTQNKYSDYYNILETSILEDKINLAYKEGKKIIIWGVSYALLAIAEKGSWKHRFQVTIIDTGGMKGRGKEITREEMVTYLKSKINFSQICSEYGMTELQSQAYAMEDGIYQMPKSMKISIRDINDPFACLEDGKSGGINVIDMANVDTCAFIETQDLGCIVSENQFKILGRIDYSDLRGCNLLSWN
jgi:hypothetical protein